MKYLLLAASITMFACVAAPAAVSTEACLAVSGDKIENDNLARIIDGLLGHGYSIGKNCTGKTTIKIELNKKLYSGKSSPFEAGNGKSKLVHSNCVLSIKLVDVASGNVLYHGRESSSFWNRYNERRAACAYVVRHILSDLPNAESLGHQ